jgi:putative glycosyltransferase (TIGR04372 family)
VLVADVHESADGQGIGYGMMLIRMRRVLVMGRALGVAVFFPPSRKAVNTIVTRLESDDPPIVAPEGAAGRALILAWRLSAPFHAGSPWLWMWRFIARRVVVPGSAALGHSPLLPRSVKSRLPRQGPKSPAMKAINAAYAASSAERWRRLDARRPRVSRVKRDPNEPKSPPIRLRLPSARLPEVLREAEALGISLTAPLVSVHVRESGYRSTAGLHQRGWDEVRNARIETFYRGFKALVERGYTVVRLGDPSMTPVSLPGVVDLATTTRSQWLDVWCTLRSEFFVGCDSGPSWLAVLLGVPVLTVNAVHFRDLARPTDRILCKLARDRSTARVLSVSEMLTEDFLRVGFKGDRYECVDNEPSDIRRAMIDMIEVVHGRERRMSWQNRFNRRLREVDRQRLGGRSALEGVAVMGHARGTLSQGFAKRYFLHRSDAPVDEADARDRSAG